METATANRGILWLVPADRQSESRLSGFAPRYNRANHIHCTLRFGVTFAECEAEIGRYVDCQLLADCWDDRIQAISVRLPDDIQCNNQCPHITMSHLSSVRPVESNRMLEGGSYQWEPILDGQVRMMAQWVPLG